MPALYLPTIVTPFAPPRSPPVPSVHSFSRIQIRMRFPSGPSLPHLPPRLISTHSTLRVFVTYSVLLSDTPWPAQKSVARPPGISHQSFRRPGQALCSRPEGRARDAHPPCCVSTGARSWTDYMGISQDFRDALIGPSNPAFVVLQSGRHWCGRSNQ